MTVMEFKKPPSDPYTIEERLRLAKIAVKDVVEVLNIHNKS